jgi:hypothetical protein
MELAEGSEGGHVLLVCVSRKSEWRGVLLLEEGEKEAYESGDRIMN